MNIRRSWVAVGILSALLIMVFLTKLPSAGTPLTGVEAGGDSTRQLIYVTIFVTMLACSGAFQNLKSAFVLPASLIFVLAWCWVSLAWALDPGTALRRLALTTMLIWVVFSTAHTAGYQAMRNTIRAILALSLLACFAAVAVLPEAVHTAGFDGSALAGDWRGVFLHKNLAGAVFAITILFFLFDAKDLNRWVRIAVLVGAAIFLYKTNSKTSMALLIPSMMAGLLYHQYNYRRRLIAIGVMIFIIVIGIFLSIYYADRASALLADDDALTGRTQIWRIILAFAQDHWLLGAGFGSFWNIEGGGPITSYVKQNSWMLLFIANGHNGYLDLLVQIGAPGLVVTIICLVILPIAKLLWFRIEPKSSGALLLAVLIFCATHNLTESSMLDRDMAMQIFLMMTLALIEVSRSGSRVVSAVPYEQRSDLQIKPMEQMRSQ